MNERTKTNVLTTNKTTTTTTTRERRTRRRIIIIIRKIICLELERKVDENRKILPEDRA